jgi:hypothetical protein
MGLSRQRMRNMVGVGGNGVSWKTSKIIWRTVDCRTWAFKVQNIRETMVEKVLILPRRG